MPAALSNFKMPLSKVTRDLTVHITLTGRRRFAFGMWLLRRALRVAAWIGGFNISIDRISN